MLGASAIALVDPHSPRLPPVMVSAGVVQAAMVVATWLVAGSERSVLGGPHPYLWWLGGAAAGGLVPAIGIAAGVDLRACAALALVGGAALRYALLRGPVEGPAAPAGPGRA